MDISFLRERVDTALSVSELNQMIKGMFESNRLLSSLNIRGEISNFVNHRSGHLYFSLKDDDGQISAVMFKSSAQKLKFIPENGMKVIVHGAVTVYPRSGSYQIYVTSIQPDGVGALYLAYEQLKSRLEAEGLFDDARKKAIPEFPSKIGVITSPTGAAVRDIINVIGRRCSSVKIYLYPALVQGDGAENTLIEGVEYFNKSRLVDTVIIGRGGGSIEDLWAFNSEKLARAIFKCDIPIISAVGHETDFTICDFVSDLRAPTPSAAAELSVPDTKDLIMRIDNLSDRSERSMLGMLGKKADKLNSLNDRLALVAPIKTIDSLREYVLQVKRDADRAFDTYLSLMRHKLEKKCEKLEALSPLSVLTRGYSVVMKNESVVSNVDDLNVGDILSVTIGNGSLDVTVNKIHPQRGK